MVSPEYLNPYNTGFYALPFKFREILQVGGVDHYVYDNQSNSSNIIYAIAVNAVTNTWVDYGTDHPYDQPVEETQPNGDVTIRLASGSANPNLFTFLKPTVADWISTGPPPNTNSVSDASVSYVVEDNELRIFIPSDKPSSWDPNLNSSGRNLYYQLRTVSGTNFWTRFYHINGFPTNETIVPTTAGIYQLEKVLTNPLDYLTYNTVEVTQAQLDFYATNNPPDDDPPENDPPPTPVFVPRSARRGNLNFW